MLVPRERDTVSSLFAQTGHTPDIGYNFRTPPPDVHTLNAEYENHIIVFFQILDLSGQFSSAVLRQWLAFYNNPNSAKANSTPAAPALRTIPISAAQPNVFRPTLSEGFSLSRSIVRTAVHARRGSAGDPPYNGTWAVHVRYVPVVPLHENRVIFRVDRATPWAVTVASFIFMPQSDVQFNTNRIRVNVGTLTNLDASVPSSPLQMC